MVNHVLEAIQNRRTIRKYEQKHVPQESLDAVLNAGRWAQSFNNAQPWTFIVIQDKQTREKLSAEAGKSVYYKGIVEAPVTVAVCVDPERDELHWVEAGCNAHQNMALAAHSLGLGSSWIAVVNTASEGPIRKILNVPKQVRIISLMPLGYPDEAPQKKRKHLDDIVRYEKYSL